MFGIKKKKKRKKTRNGIKLEGDKIEAKEKL